MKPRFTIGGMLGLVVLFGISFAAFRSPSPLWANVMYTAAVAAMMTAAVNSVFARGSRRRFWGGFAICGGAYFVMCFVPPYKDDMCLRTVTTPILEFLYAQTGPGVGVGTPVLQQAQIPGSGTVNLATTLNAIQTIQPYVASPSNVVSSPGSTILWQWPNGTLNASPPPSLWSIWTTVDPNDGSGMSLGGINLATTLSYRRIGHSLFMLLIGLTGGLLTRWAFPVPAAEALAIPVGPEPEPGAALAPEPEAEPGTKP